MAERTAPDDVWIYIYDRGLVRMRDLEQAFVATRKISRPTLYRYKRRLEAEGKIQAHPTPGHPPYNTYSVPEHHHQVLNLLRYGNPFALMTGKRLENIPWEDGPEGFYITDVKQKVLWRNEETGATMILLKSPADDRPADPLHFHPHANQWSFGLEGEGIEQDGEWWAFKGSTGYIPKGRPHGGAVIVKESLALVFWDGPRTSVIIDDATYLSGRELRARGTFPLK